MKKIPFTYEDKQNMADLYVNKEHTQEQIALMYGTSRSSVARYLKEVGVTGLKVSMDDEHILFVAKTHDIFTGMDLYNTLNKTITAEEVSDYLSSLNFMDRMALLINPKAKKETVNEEKAPAIG